MPSAQVLLALQQATVELAVRHYLAHTQKPRGAAAVQTEQHRHRQRAVQVETLCSTCLLPAETASAAAWVESEDRLVLLLVPLV
jgi:hypothetical protein